MAMRWSCRVRVMPIGAGREGGEEGEEEDDEDGDVEEERAVRCAS